MVGQGAMSCAEVSNSKAIRKRNNNYAAVKIQQMMRQFSQQWKKMSQLEKSEIAFQKQYSLQVAFFNEKISTINTKLMELKRENRKIKKLMIENEKLRKENVELERKIDELNKENVRMSREFKRLALKDQNTNFNADGDQNRRVTRSQSISQRIQEVIAEFESKYTPHETLPPSVSIFNGFAFE